MGATERDGSCDPTVARADALSELYLPLLDEAVSWLRYLNILEPECGTCVPAWPLD
jgi:hypothetical protein